MRKALALVLASAIAMSAPGALAQEKRKTPYWASISSGQARMRTGPGENYPVTWLYQRADLPIKVLEIYPSWRKIQDPEGTSGWMRISLLSERRTAIVRGTEPRPLHEAPQAGAKVVFRAEPGVVGRLSECARNWCRFTAGDRGGFISTDHIWGTDAGETIK